MINNLTKEQEAMLPVYRDKWLKLGLHPEKFTLEEATPIVNGLYDILEKPHPKAITIMDNPLECWSAACLLQSVNNNGDWSQMESHVRSQVLSQVESQVESHVRPQVGSQVRSQVWSQMGSQVWSRVWSHVGSQVRSQIPDFVYLYSNGNIMSGYFSYYDFMLNELKAKHDCKLWDKWFATHKLSLMYPLDNYCVLLQHYDYCKIHNDKLHCDNGAAIHYPGFDIYSLNGVRVPEWLVTTPWDKIDCQEIMKEKNAEVRREIVRKVGIERVCSELNAKCVDKKDDYELLLLDLGDERRRPYLKMKNPSIGCYHIEGVHPDCKTVEEALNFRNGTKEVPVVLT